MKKLLFYSVLCTVMLWGCVQKTPTDMLAAFYSDYLALSCGDGVSDYGRVQECLKNYLSPRVADELEQRRDAEREDWLDYDIFIQGQDCWLGIRAEKITQVEGTDWYDVVVAQPDNINHDSIVNREHVFFYVEKGDDGWRIGAVDDRHNRIGSAPRNEEAALKRHQWKLLQEEGVRWETQYADEMTRLLEREAAYNIRLNDAAQRLNDGMALDDDELIALLPDTRDRYMVFWHVGEWPLDSSEGRQKSRPKIIDSVVVSRAAEGCTPLMHRYVAMLEWADGWPGEYIYEGVSYLRHCHPAEVDAALDSLFPDSDWQKEEIQDHQEWFEYNSTNKRWK